MATTMTVMMIAVMANIKAIYVHEKTAASSVDGFTSKKEYIF